MVSQSFILDVEEVIERGLPAREVRVAQSHAVILGWTFADRWQVRSQVNRAVGDTLRLEADQLIVYTTEASIRGHLPALPQPPDQTSTTTMATLMTQDEVSEAIAELLVRDFLPGDPRDPTAARRNVLNVQQAVQAVARQGVIVQL